MNYTIFNTPVLNKILYYISIVMLKATGWQAVGRKPDCPRFVLTGAPHTSNWDLPYALFVAFVLGINISWMGKDILFQWPLEGFFKWLGGIPVNRSRSTNTVEQSIRRFHQHENLILTIAPAGTRKRVKKWKTGFYYIAVGADVPIVLGFLDYRRKKGGMGPTIYPTGNIETDMKTIRSFYNGITGKHPEKSTTARDAGS
jgi:1-acyl-sn-glycerol-3-phosphate acyltransferase